MSAGLFCRLSALILGVGGLVLLFGADLILPELLPDFPASAFWFGQFLGAAWLGFAVLNWYSRRTLLGGIYGRPVVFANFVHWFVAAMVLLGAARRLGATPAFLVLLGTVTLLALGFAALLFRGPFQRDLRRHGML